MHGESYAANNVQKLIGLRVRSVFEYDFMPQRIQPLQYTMAFPDHFE